MQNVNEKKFFKALEDIFIGVKIEGAGGYVNLASIKSKYFLNIIDVLKSDIDRSVSDFPDFKEELFDKLYSFFNRYFTQSGSIYFNYSPFSEKVYEQVYTNDKDVILFWKTNMLYYVKSEILYQDMVAEVKGVLFHFNAKGIEHNKNNEKKDLVFSIDKIDSIKGEKPKVEVSVTYSERGRKTKTDQLIKMLNTEGIAFTETDLAKVFRTFKSQTEVDYFINKNANAFLKEQFDMWLYQYMFKETLNSFPQQRLNQLRIIKEIAYDIIDFIAQFEDELVRIWNKPKFVLDSNYVISLGEILRRNTDSIDLVKKHHGLTEQLLEWKDFGYINDGINPEELIEDRYQNLPLDTKYFKSIEKELLSHFKEFDANCNGVLIKSDNYQALNTVKTKYKGRVKVIYIDPPYNTEDDEFIYKDKMKHSSWITMMHNRLELAHELLAEDGALFVQIDYKELHNLKYILEDIFEEENFVQLISVKTSSPAGFKTVNPGPIDVTEYILFVTKNKSAFNFKKMYTKVDYDTNYNLFIENKEDSPENWKLVSIIDKFYEISGIKNTNDAKKQWGENWKVIRDIGIAEFALENADQIVSKRDPHKPTDKVKQLLKESKKIDNVIRVEREGMNDLLIYKGGSLTFYSNKIKNLDGEIVPTELLTDFWSDLSWAGIANEGGVNLKNGKKPERLLKRLIEMATSDDPNEIVMDFFSGSGTSLAVAQKMGKKWIGIEFGEHFEDITLRRLKNVINGDSTGVSKVLNWSGGGFFKYYRLEQYEDVLRNAVYRDDQPMLFNTNKSEYEQYVFLRDEKLTRAIEVDENHKVKTDVTKIYDDVSLVETISNLLGKDIKSINQDGFILEDTLPFKSNDIEFTLLKPLIWW